MCATISTAWKWPPAPRVEEELDALSYEISTVSISTDNGDDESVLSRGSIDQYPIILPTEISESANLPAVESKDLTPEIAKLPANVSGNRESTSSKSGPSSLKRSQSERKRPNKVRFSEVLYEKRFFRDRAGSDPSEPTVTHLQEPVGENEYENAILPYKKPNAATDRPRRDEVFSKMEGPRYAVKSDRPSQNARRRDSIKSYPPTSYRHFPTKTIDYPSDPEDSQKNSRRSSLQFVDGSDHDYFGEYQKPTVEWHSDDEISSSYRGANSLSTRELSRTPINREQNLRSQFSEAASFSRSRNTTISDGTPTPGRPYPIPPPHEPRAVRVSAEVTTRKSHQPYRILPEHGKEIVRSGRTRSASFTPQQETISLENRSQLQHMGRHTSDPAALTLSSPSSAWETHSRQTAFPPIAADSQIRDYHGRLYPLNQSRISQYQQSSPPPEILPVARNESAMVTFAPESQSLTTREPSTYRSSAIPVQHPLHRRQYNAARLSLPPCPRSIAIAGYSDWCTIIGLTHLDICGSCTEHIADSRFRSLLIPSQPKLRDLPVRCSFSQPWTRLAWVQTMKLRLNHLELVYQVTQPRPNHLPCPGRVPSVQPWYRVSDPETGRVMPEFNACTSCFRNVQILIPALRDSFQSGPLVQEGTCDLRCGSTRFIQYLDLLDVAARRGRHLPQQTPDLRDFVRYVKRKSDIYDCPRDHLVVGPWHCIPELSEFTVCEDCYDDVVWPFGNSPVASLVSRTVQLAPETKGSSSRGYRASCQLYSPRMRHVFREAVRRGDYGYLKAAVLSRYQAETVFREKKKLLLEDVARGYDRDAELRKNAEEWKQYE